MFSVSGEHFIIQPSGGVSRFWQSDWRRFPAQRGTPSRLDVNALPQTPIPSRDRQGAVLKNSTVSLLK